MSGNADDEKGGNGAAAEDNKEQEDPLVNVDPKSTTPQQQRVLMKRVGYKMQHTGELWYPVSKKWYTSWINYTCFTKADDDIPGGLENLGNGDVPRPGPIDNSDLADDSQEGQLKREIEEHLTHEWVHSEKWDLLVSWYGGGPAFPRKVYERGNNREKYICVHPRLVRMISCSEKTNGEIDENGYEIRGFPLDYSLKSMADDLEQEIPDNEDEDDEKQRNSRNNRNNKNDDDAPKVHLWARFAAVKGIYPINKRIVVTEDDLKDEDPKRWVEVPDDYLRTKLDDMKFDDDKAEIVVEYQNKDGTWPLAKSEDDWKNFQIGDIIDCIDVQNGWYEVTIRCVGKGDKQGQLAVHYIGWAIKWDEWVDIEADPVRMLKRGTKTKGPHRPRRNQRGAGGFSSGLTFSYHSHDEGRPTQSGVVGLRNLGNTCFMNSTLQCLAQSPWLTQDYFLSGEFVHHINKKNPLGWKGKVATAWAHLLSDMFSDKYRVIAPRQFKDAIGEVAPRFMGYAQQDSQELLSFLLDGLHEDLNQIIDKPVTEQVESNGRKDTIVALESWRTYLRRNQSIIVDLMQGQLKSRVECPDCPRISITFDPYMFLSVPLPTAKYKVVEFTWVGANVAEPVIYGLKMHKYGDIGMLKDKVAKQFDVHKDELFVCDIWKSNIHREYRRKDNVSDINRKSDDIFIYHSPRLATNANNNTNNNNNDDPTNNANNNGDEPDLPQHDPVDDAPANGAPGPGDVPAGEVPAGAANGAAADGPRGGTQRGAQGAQGQEESQARWQTFVVVFQRQVMRRQQYSSYGRQSEEELMGYPLLVTFDLNEELTMRAVRDRIFALAKPFVRDDSIDVDDNELPFVMYAQWGYNNVATLNGDDNEFDLNQRNMKFIIHFGDAQQFRNEFTERTNRRRDASAPAPIDPRTGRSADDEDDSYGKAISLEACIDAYIEEEVLGEEDAWYCSQCKEHKQAKKKLDLWSTPDLLIIHLKRFSYTRQWRDRINTLIKFPIEGLDLSDYVLDPESKKLATYDLYAISNHMGGLGGGHYTAYAQNLFNKKWYLLDDSRASEVHNLEGMVSSAAYVLYYKRRYPAKIKHRASRIIIPDETVVNELNNPDQ